MVDSFPYSFHTYCSFPHFLFGFLSSYPLIFPTAYSAPHILFRHAWLMQTSHLVQVAIKASLYAFSFCRESLVNNGLQHLGHCTKIQVDMKKKLMNLTLSEFLCETPKTDVWWFCLSNLNQVVIFHKTNQVLTIIVAVFVCISFVIVTNTTHRHNTVRQSMTSKKVENRSSFSSLF